MTLTLTLTLTLTITLTPNMEGKNQGERSLKGAEPLPGNAPKAQGQTDTAGTHNARQEGKPNPTPTKTNPNPKKADLNPKP